MKHTFYRTLTLSLAFLMIASALVLAGCKATGSSKTAHGTAAVETISDYSVPLAAPQRDTSEAFDSTPVRGAAPIAHPPVTKDHATEAPNP